MSDESSEHATPQSSLGCLLGGLAFSGVFLVAGAALLYSGFIKPFSMIRASESWVDTPCTIIRSEARPDLETGPNEPSRSDQAHWVLEIEYRYTFEGQEYVSERYGVSRVVDGREDWRRQVVEDLPAGSSAVCFVNPQDPSEAALSREFHANKAMIAIPLVMFLLGLTGVIFVVIGALPDKVKPVHHRDRERSTS